MLVRLAPILVAVLSACTAGRGESSGSNPTQEPAPVEVADPMAAFARLIPGEWRLTLASGARAFKTWDWGPGKHSIREGELEVMYWHPLRKQVRLLCLHAEIPGVGRGSGEGTVRFDGETLDGFLDLYQPRGVRKLGVHWTFHGPDQFHDELLEATGPEGFGPQNAWDYFRVPERAEAQARASEEAPKLAEHLKLFQPLLGTWETKGEAAVGDVPHVRSTFEFVPDYVYARVVAPGKDGESAHVLDAYVYQDVRTKVLRCLALSVSGGVYEGEVSERQGGALQLDLEGYEGDRIVPVVVRFDLEKDGTLRGRVWTLEGTARTVTLDVRHEKVQPK